ncbi:MAG TPA: hypothetical protein VK524_22375 [Polyangiaceae bacterium]|nr:hypothetical protein [Polyangiaceae bacterium]
MAARENRPATPPPASDEYARFGAVVSLTAWRAPTEPTEAEVTAVEVRIDARANEERFAVALRDVRRVLQAVFEASAPQGAPSVPVRRRKARAA